MEYVSPSFDSYDDGLVHSHDWSRSTPPGEKPSDRKAGSSHDHAKMQADRIRS